MRCGARAAQLRDMAEEEGLEPSNAGIKIRCLNQLGDSPVEGNSSSASNASTVKQKYGGEDRIRTCVPVNRPTEFQSAPFDHSRHLSKNRKQTACEVQLL